MKKLAVSMLMILLFSSMSLLLGQIETEKLPKRPFAAEGKPSPANETELASV
ncbi:MAG: hypothetical protein JXA73_10230 [Acidobacteria bacterium]|nr:hypothetical protein [Acidobacteriota bacterium]